MPEYGIGFHTKYFVVNINLAQRMIRPRWQYTLQQLLQRDPMNED